MTIEKKSLLKELKWIKGFVAKKATVPVLAHVCLTRESNALILAGSDLEVGGMSTLLGKGRGKWAISVPPMPLIHYLEAVKANEVELTVKDSTLTVKHGDASAGFSGMSGDSFPELPFAKPTMTITDLGTAVPRVTSSVSKEESRFTLDGGLLEVRESGEAFLVGTDGHRLSHSTLAVETPAKTRAIIPTKALTMAAGMNGGSARFGCEEDNVTFLSGTRVIVSRKLTGNFPDYERVLPKSPAHHLTLDTQALKRAINQVKVFADERSRGIILRLSKGKLTVYASSSENGSGSAEVPCDWNGTAMELGYNLEFLLDFLALAPEQTDFHFTDPKSAGQLSTDGWRYVVMPMRI